MCSETEHRVEVMQRQRDDERRQFTEEVLRIRRDLRRRVEEQRRPTDSTDRRFRRREEVGGVRMDTPHRF